MDRRLVEHREIARPDADAQEIGAQWLDALDRHHPEIRRRRAGGLGIRPAQPGNRIGRGLFQPFYQHRPHGLQLIRPLGGQRHRHAALGLGKAHPAQPRLHGDPSLDILQHRAAIVLRIAQHDGADRRKGQPGQQGIGGQGDRLRMGHGLSCESGGGSAWDMARRGKAGPEGRGRLAVAFP